MHSLIYKMIYIFILTLSFSVIVYNINSIKLSIKSIVLFTLINYLINYLLYIGGYNNLLMIFIVTSILTYTYRLHKKIDFSTMITAFTVIIYALSDLIISSIEILVLNINRAEIIENPKLYLITMVFILINSFILSRFIKMITTRYFHLYLKKYLKYMLILSSFLIVIVVFAVVFMYIYRGYSVVGNKITLVYSTFVIYSFIVIAILLFNSFKDIEKELEKGYKDREYSQFKEYTEELETLTCDLRKFRHDYLNILKTLGGYIESENIIELKKYYVDIVNESEFVLNKEDKCFMLLQYIKIDPLKSLIASKVIRAQSLGIKTHIEITEDIDILSIKVIDICRIIGIFLDNATEAAVESEEKTIEFAIIKNEESVIFIIINSCTKDTPPVYKIYEKNFSNKGPDRGIGLKTVREIISEKYSTNATLSTKIMDLKFTQELIIKR